MLKLKRCFESNTRELNQIKRAIFSNPEVKRLTSKIFQDDQAWTPFKNLIRAIKNSDNRIQNVYYQDDPATGNNGYIWRNGKPTSKYRTIEVETDFGTLKGQLNCYRAGTVEDPLSAYDMTLNLWVDKSAKESSNSVSGLVKLIISQLSDTQALNRQQEEAISQSIALIKRVPNLVRKDRENGTDKAFDACNDAMDLLFNAGIKQNVLKAIDSLVDLVNQ